MVVNVVLIIHALGMLLSLPLGLLPVEPVLALGFSKLVDLGAGKSSKELLGEGMWDRLSLFTLVVLEGLEAGECGTSGNQLMAKAWLVLLKVLVLVDTLVVLLVLVYMEGVNKVIEGWRGDYVPKKPMTNAVVYGLLSSFSDAFDGRGLNDELNGGLLIT
jgi:hypothetical protein